MNNEYVKLSMPLPALYEKKNALRKNYVRNFYVRKSYALGIDIITT